MATIEASGKWWLPGAPDQRVSGTLSIDPDGRAELKLIGALRSWDEGGETVTNDGVATTTFSEQSIAKASVYPRILGVSDAKSYTLEDCFEVKRHMNLMDYEGGSQTLHVGQVFKGVHFESHEALDFSAVVVHMDWLPYWVPQGGIAESVSSKSSDDGKWRIDEHLLSVKPVVTKECEGLDGTKILLGQTYGIDGDTIVERRVWQDFFLSVECEPLMPLTDLLKQVGILQDLVSIGTGKIAAFKRVQLYRPDVHRQVGRQGKQRVSVEMYAPWQVINKTPPKVLTTYDMPFTFDQLGGMNQLPDWLATANEHRLALSRVMSTRYARQRYSADLFMNCAAAIEGYDRDKNGDKVIYIERVRRCALHASQVFTNLVGDIEKWSEEVRDLRNDVAHNNPGLDTGGPRQFILAETAYWLVVLCLLKDAGASSQVFSNIEDHRGYQWLKRQLQDWWASK